MTNWILLTAAVAAAIGCNVALARGRDGLSFALWLMGIVLTWWVAIVLAAEGASRWSRW